MTPSDADSRSVPTAVSIGPVLVFVVALALRLAFQIDAETRIGVDSTRIPELDQGAFHRTALRLADGDWLLRDVYRPYHWWYQRIAPASTFESWYPRRAYHQSPLYPYFVAGAYSLVRPDARVVFILQAVLGACTAVMTFFIARRFVPGWGALLAGLLFAAYAPAIVYDGALLRAGLVTLTSMAWILTWLRALERRTSARRWAATAAVLGACVLAKPNMSIFAPVLAVSFAMSQWREGKGALARGAVAVLAFATVLAPVVARNVVVGAPPLSMTTRGPYAFVNGNASASNGIGWFPPETQEVLLDVQAKEILARTEAKFVPTLVATLETHADDPLGYVGLLGAKALAFVRADEIPNNLDVNSLRRVIPWMQWLPGFWWIAPFAAVGMALGARSRRLAPLWIYAIGYGLVTIAFYVIGRFRLPVVPVLAVFAAYGIVELVRLARGRAWLRFAAGAAIAVIAAMLVRPVYPAPSDCAARILTGDQLALSGDTVAASSWYMRALRGSGAARDRLIAAWRLINIRANGADIVAGVSSVDVLRSVRDIMDGGLDEEDRALAHCLIAMIHASADRDDAARVEIHEALRVDPDNVEATLFQAYLLRRAGDLAKAREVVETSLDRDPKDAPSLLLYGEILADSGEVVASQTALRDAIRHAGADRMTRDRAQELLYGPGGGIR